MAATASTTRNRAADPPPGAETGATAAGRPDAQRHDPAATWVAAGLAFVLLGLALPRFAGEVLVLDARQTVTAALGDGREPAPAIARIESAAQRIGQAGGLTGDAYLMADRGMLLLRRAQAEPPGPERNRLIGAAITATEQGLARNPAQAGAWARLAYMRALLDDRPGAAAALRLSFLAGAVSPQIMASRLSLGLYLLDDLDAEQRSLLARQIRLLWVVQPTALTDIASEPDAQAFLSEALAAMSEADVASFVRRHGTAGPIPSPPPSGP